MKIATKLGTFSKLSQGSVLSARHVLWAVFVVQSTHHEPNRQKMFYPSLHRSLDGVVIGCRWTAVTEKVEVTETLHMAPVLC